jgi:hypothetical protein
MASLDCSEERGREWAESAGVKERCQVLLRLGVPDGAIGGVANLEAGRWVTWCWGWLGGQRDVPEAVGCVSFADYDNVAVFINLDVVLGEQCNTIVVAELANRDEGTGLEVFENVSQCGSWGEFG